MQSMPYYQQQGYPTQTPYQTSGAPTSNVLNNGGPMLSHPNGLPPMQHPGIISTTDQSGAVTQQPPKRKQVKNACSKFLYY